MAVFPDTEKDFVDAMITQPQAMITGGESLLILSNCERTDTEAKKSARRSWIPYIHGQVRGLNGANDAVVHNHSNNPRMHAINDVIHVDK